MADSSTRSSAQSGQPRGSAAWRSIVANWVAFGFTAAVAFAMSPFVLHNLGDTAYGVWVLLATMVGYLGLLDLGVRGAVTRYVARYRAMAQGDEAGHVTSAALAIFTAMGLLAVVIAVGLATVALPLFQIPAEYAGPARMVVILGGIAFAVSLVSGVFGGILAASERFDLLSGAEVLSTSLRAVSVYVALSYGAGLVGLAVIQLGYTLARGSLNYVLARRQYPELRLSWRNWGRLELRRIFSFSLFSTFLHVSEAAILETDAVLIAAFMPVHMITFFAIASNLTLHARRVISGISHTIIPRTSALQAGEHQDELKSVTLKGGRLATLVVLPIVVTFLVRGESFIGLWMGPVYAATSSRILTILSVALVAAAGRQVATQAIIGVNRHRQLAPWYVGEAVANLGLSLALVQSMGLEGVALGTAIPSLCVSVLVIPWYVRKIFGIGVWHTYREFWIRPLVAMVPFALLSYAVECLWPVGSLHAFFMQVAVIFPVAIAGAWLLGLGSKERSSYSLTVTKWVRVAWERS